MRRWGVMVAACALNFALAPHLGCRQAGASVNSRPLFIITAGGMSPLKLGVPLTMRMVVLVVLLASCCALPAQVLGPRAATTGLSQPSHRVLEGDFSGAGLFVANAPPPAFDRGYFISMAEWDAAGPDRTAVVLFDAKGRQARAGKIWFSGAMRVHVHYAGATETGDIIASGHAFTSDGANALFIAKTDSSGNVTQVVRTNPFAPSMVCASADGTLWSFGRELDTREDFAMLRQYSLEGGLLRQFLPRSSFPPRSSPAAISGGFQGSFLHCAKDRVALYVNQTDEYVQLTFSDHVLQRWVLDMSSVGRAKVSGFAVTDAGHVYASLDEQYTGGDPGLTGLYELDTRAGTSTARWVPVNGTVGLLDRKQGIPRGSFMRLWGTDGQNLIISRSGDFGFSWVTPLFQPAH